MSLLSIIEFKETWSQMFNIFTSTLNYIEKACEVVLVIVDTSSILGPLTICLFCIIAKSPVQMPSWSPGTPELGGAGGAAAPVALYQEGQGGQGALSI
jgi:hypothetical protein